MLRPFALIIALSTVLVAGGCSASPPLAAPSSTATAAPTRSRDPMTGVSSPAWSEEELDQPVPLAGVAAGDLSLPWAFISLSADRQKVRVGYIAGDNSCVLFTGFRVTQTDTSITLTATARYSTTPPPSACPAMLAEGAGTISLDSPLGSRTLIHAAVSAQPSFPPPNASR